MTKLGVNAIIGQVLSEIGNKGTIVKSLLVFFFILFFPLYIQAETITIKTNNLHRFIVISDIHFNPFFVCQEKEDHCAAFVNALIKEPYTSWEKIFENNSNRVSRYSQDTDYVLLKFSINYLKSFPEETDFVIASGDFLAHHFMEQYQLYTGDKSLKNYQFFVTKTFQFITAELKNAFPDTSVYPIIGNNDSYVGDYFNDSKGMFYHALVNIWSPLIIQDENKKAFLNTFTEGGYYSATPDNNRSLDRLIILNSVLFSEKAKGSHTENAAKKEMQWLETQLSTAAESGEHVLIVMHIPYGIDVFSTLSNANKSPVLFWKSQYNQSFLDLIKKYSFIITGVLSAHTHMDSLQLSAVDENQHQFIINSSTPSLSPAFGNNPAFKLYSYDDNFQLKDFITYYLNLANPSTRWNVEYDFNKIYQHACHDCDLMSGALTIHQIGTAAERYQQYYSVESNSQPITKGEWLPYYWCGIYNQTAEDYQICVAKFRSR